MILSKLRIDECQSICHTRLCSPAKSWRSKPTNNFVGSAIALVLFFNAVVNIISYYKKVELSSAIEFECHAGSGAHVYLKGDLAKIAGE